MVVLAPDCKRYVSLVAGRKGRSKDNTTCHSPPAGWEGRGRGREECVRERGLYDQIHSWQQVFLTPFPPSPPTPLSLRAPFSEGISLLLKVVGSRQVVGNKWECWARNLGVTMHL